MSKHGEGACPCLPFDAQALLTCSILGTIFGPVQESSQQCRKPAGVLPCHCILLVASERDSSSG